MRRIIWWAMSTLSALVLLFSYHTSTQSRTASAAASTGTTPTSTAATTSPATTSPTGAATPAAAAGAASGSTASGSSSSSSSSTKTYTGNSVQTRWGPVQVRITVQGGRITAADAVVYPTGNGRDREINAYALPILGQEVVQAQSAQIDMVSGATVTSEGYLSSLQSAIDKAHQ